MLHRFTGNITLIYDNDAAGIHAALRGTDMLLAEGMSLKVLLLPDGQDPDEFARSHTAEDFRKYIDEHQEDFIQFKTSLLLRGETDPKKRADGINSIVESISMIQDPILRDTYIHDCSQRTGMAEATLISRMNGYIRSKSPNATPAPQTTEHNAEERIVDDKGEASSLIIRLIVKHGECIIYNNVEDDNGVCHNLTIAQVVYYSLSQDHLSFSNELYNRILHEAAERSADPQWKAEPYFLHHDDINICRVASELSADAYHVTQPKDEAPINEEARKQKEANQMDTLRGQTEHLLLDFRMNYVEKHLKELQAQMMKVAGDMDKLKKLMEEFKDMQQIRNLLAKKLGNNIFI